MEEEETDYTTMSLFDKRERAGTNAKFSYISNRKKRRALRGISKKGSVRKTPSSFQTILNRFYAQRAVPEQVDTELKKSGLVLTDNERELLRSLIEAQTGIQRIGYPKLLVKPYMKLWKTISVQFGGITNNLYFWQIKAHQNWPLQYSTIYYIKNVYLCSGMNPIVLEEDTEIKECSFIDNTVEVCVIFKKELLPADLERTVLVTQDPVQFMGKELRLYALTIAQVDVFVLVATREMTLEQVRRFYQQVTMIYEKKGIQRGLRKIVKGAGTYFFQKDLELTNFANSYVQLNEPVDFHALLEAEMNLEELFASLVNNQGDNTVQINAINSEVYWENFLEYIDFYILYCSYVNQPENAENLVKYRRQITVIRNHVLKAKNIMTRYLDSFPSSINIDKLNELIKKINEFLLEEEEVKADAVFYGEISQFLGALGIRSIREYFNRDVVLIIKLMKEACQVLLNRDVAIADVVTKIRAVAVECLQCSLVGDYKIFPFIRSTYAFLGNTFGNKTIEQLQESLQAFRDRVENREERYNERMDEIMDVTAARLGQLVRRMDEVQREGGVINVNEVAEAMNAIVNTDNDVDLGIAQMDLREAMPLENVAQGQIQQQGQNAGRGNLEPQPGIGLRENEREGGVRGRGGARGRGRRNASVQPVTRQRGQNRGNLNVRAEPGVMTRNQYRRIEQNQGNLLNQRRERGGN